MKMKIEIKSVLGKVLFSYESEENTIKKTVVEAARRGADLRGADLRDADLRGADLRGADLQGAYLQCAYLQCADLRGADLQCADLRGADLQGAYLQCADLQGAYLRGAYLRGADLQGADLQCADLRGADLQGADLQGAYLRGAYLRGAELTPIKTDFWDVLLRAQPEIKGLKESIIAGKINGSTYEGECACLVGTIANVRSVQFKELVSIKPDCSRPIERFFLAIKEGDTPENNPVSQIVLEWIEEFETFITPR